MPLKTYLKVLDTTLEMKGVKKQTVTYNTLEDREKNKKLIGLKL